LTRVRKAVILAAGYGTRLLPATKATPKEMIPLIDKPAIQYSVEEAVAAGLTQVIIVTSAGKRSIEDYFDRHSDLEAQLTAKGDTARLAELERLHTMADFVFVRQARQNGLGDAVRTARAAVHDEPFVLFLPDDIVLGEPSPTQELVQAYEKHGASVIAVEEVDPQETGSYGIVAGDRIDDRTTKLTTLVEKPAPAVAPSNLAIVGRYLLTPTVFDAIGQTAAGYGGEIQITDALQRMADGEGMYAYRFTGDRYDTGRPLGLLKASIAVGLGREDIAPGLAEYLRGLKLPEA
jgi:UTP--glucose-1-phosphate uridylyltransferase